MLAYLALRVCLRCVLLAWFPERQPRPHLEAFASRVGIRAEVRVRARAGVIVRASVRVRVRVGDRVRVRRVRVG